MKRIFFIIALLFFTLLSNAQFPIGATSGTPSSGVLSRGRLSADSLFQINSTCFTDTSVANRGVIEQIAGAMVRTCDGKIWVRNEAKTRWIEQAAGSGVAQCGLRNGGFVAWDSLLVFNISPAVYCISGVEYSSSQTNKTLAASDPTNPRIDIIALDATGVIVIQGTAAASPSEPNVLPTQIRLVSVLINAAATTPSGVTSTTIYDENTEWTTSSSSVTVDYNNTASPFHFVKAASTGAVTSASTLIFTNSSDITIASYSVLTFMVNLKEEFAFNTQISVYWANSSDQKICAPLNISNGTYGYLMTTTGSYQRITIPIPAFALESTTARKLYIQMTGSNASGLYIDYIRLESGLDQPPTPTGSVTNFLSGNLSPLFTTTVTNPTTTPYLTFTQASVNPGTVFASTEISVDIPDFTHDLALGSTTVGTGLLRLRGGTSGTITIQPQDAAGTFNFNLPTTAGTSGHLLTSGGGGSNPITYTDPATVGKTYTASEGITLSTLDFQLGGTVSTDRTLTLGANTILITANTLAGDPALSITSTSTAAASNLQKGINVNLSGVNATASQVTYGAYISNSHTGTSAQNFGVAAQITNGTSSSVAISGNTVNGDAFQGSSTNGYLISGGSTNNIAINVTSSATVAAFLTSDVSATNTVQNVLLLQRGTTGTSANGLGGGIEIDLESSTGNNRFANQIQSKWTDATDATRTSQFIITGVNSAVTGDILTLNGNKSIQLNGYGSGTFTGTATKFLAVDASGNVIEENSPGGSSTWNGITNPTGDQSLTFDAGESSTWTDANTTEDLFTVNSSTGTTNSMLSFNRTGTALAAGNNIAEFISSGANGTNGITATGVRISVTNTNATSGTNTALSLTASGATTNNYALEVTSGQTILPAGTSSVPTIKIGAAGLYEFGGGTGVGFYVNNFARAVVGDFGFLIRDGATAVIDMGRSGTLGGTNYWRLSGPAVGTIQLGMESTQQAMIFKSANNAGTDANGFAFTHQSSAGTGTGIPGNLLFQTSVPTTTGTTVQTFGDRYNIVGKYTTLTETTATSFVRVNVPSGTVSGGEIVVTVEANDGTEFQSRTLRFIWTASNKAGTTTITIGTPEEVAAVSSGTLTATITAVDAGSGNIDFKADATSSLTQTVLRANCQVSKNMGTGTIIAQ